MYKVKFYGKRTPKPLAGTFESYESARNAVRRWLTSKGFSRLLGENGITIVTATSR